MMTEEQFDAQVQAVKDQSKAKIQEGVALLDQGLAKVFLNSGWTQEQIGERIGKSKVWVSYSLRLARFLDQLTTVNCFTTPRNLTERRFRKYWEASPKRPSGLPKKATDKQIEEARFNLVAESMESDFVLSKPKAPVATKVLEAYGNWQWRTAEDMAEELEEDFDRVHWAMRSFKEKNSYSTRIEERKYATTKQYRFKVLPKAATKKTVTQLADEILPLCRQGIKFSRDSNQVEYSRGMNAEVFGRIMKLVREILGK